ncbi:cytochrome P450 [Sphingomonas aerophila]|uniref:Cytochrome P450 n=1 Tax=Sphingomonas aerophila TaxID=1344948 RepID=A0A7W9EVK0_9SPHN|nr:cytochrome P450 [Sphingomonas aerophila]MBB5714578.1 cytochrome P450 [Sphingomonas aerophila]
MTPAVSGPIYRWEVGRKGQLAAAMLQLAPPVMALLRTVRPLLRLGSFWVVTRYDDVLEVFDTDAVYGVPYQPNLQVITASHPFFLGMPDGPEYQAQLATMQAVVLASDLPHLGDEAERLAAARIGAANGRIELVSFVRGVAFDLIARYFGISEPAPGSFALWGSRLFEFQFTGSAQDKAWRAEAEEFAVNFQKHIDRAIAARREVVAAGVSPDDVLGRCLARQAAGAPGYSDVEIRTAILCMIVGGPPQPPMVLPQAIEQLLRRPAWFAAAQQAARLDTPDNNDRLRAIITEAMRFDPLAPGFKRVALSSHELASGTPRARRIPAGATVFAATASAMMDERRVPQPSCFDPDRHAHNYLHFGHGLHECFGRFINHATLHRMVKPLLARPGLRRARGSAGRLEKRGPFAHRLELVFDDDA